MELTEGNKQFIMIVLLLVMFLVLAVELMYIRSKKRKSLNKFNETRSEEAFNVIHTTNRIITTMRSLGVDVAEAETFMREARQYQAQGNHDMAISRSEMAKDVLKTAKARFDREQASGDDAPSGIHDHVEPVTFKQPVEDPLLPTPPSAAVKKPDNYLQSKFLLGTVRGLLKKEENQDIPGAREMFENAKAEFGNENYTKALSLALKAEKMLKVRNLGHIAETPIPHSGDDIDGEAEEEVIEEEEFEHRHQRKHTVVEGIIETGDVDCDSCGAEVHIDDAFCRKCGDKLEFIIVCPGCEAEVESDDMFCRKCGERLG